MQLKCIDNLFLNACHSLRKSANGLHLPPLIEPLFNSQNIRKLKSPQV